jgi:hypothetical protein
MEYPNTALFKLPYMEHLFFRQEACVVFPLLTGALVTIIPWLQAAGPLLDDSR